MQYLPYFRRLTLSVSFFALLSSAALAHPGHGIEPEGSGVLHYLLSPSHLGVAGLVGAVGIGIVMVLMRRRTRLAWHATSFTPGASTRHG